MSDPETPSHQHTSGSGMNKTQLAIVTFLLTKRVASAGPATISIGCVIKANKTPMVVLSPRPPLKPMEIGKLCPSIAAKPAPSTQGWEIPNVWATSIVAAPLAISAIRTTIPYQRPICRKIAPAPMLPMSTSRMSMFFLSLAMM